MTLNKLIFPYEYLSYQNFDNIEISNVTTCAEEIKTKTLFVLIKSIKFDVNKIIDYILEKKPTVVLCDEDIDIESDKVIIIHCPSTRRLLPFILARFYGVDFQKMRFIGITGTNGKTTTATMLAHILSFNGRRVGFIGTGKIIINGKLYSEANYSMTTPDPSLLYSTIRKMQEEKCEFVVMEVSSHALYFDKVLPIPYEISIFTNLSPEHLDFHKTTEEYFETKLKLFAQTEYGIFNMDDLYSRRAYDTVVCRKECIGIINGADIIAEDITMNGLEGSHYIYKEKSRLFKVCLQLGGAFNVYNSMMAIAGAIKLGIKPCEAKKAISTLDFVDGRLEVINDIITVVIDYAHTEEAYKNVLKLLNSHKKYGQKLIVVFGCGGERDRYKRPKIASAAEKYSDLVVVTTDNSRNESESDIISDILSGFTLTSKRQVITSRKSAIEYAIMTANLNDIVAVIGKGHERYSLDKNGVHFFDERTVIKEALEKRKKNYENCP